MRLSELTDEALEQLASDYDKGAAWLYAQDRVKATSQANAAIVRELLDRRHADELRKRTKPAIKLAIAHVEALLECAVKKEQDTSVACLAFQLDLLKEFDL